MLISIWLENIARIKYQISHTMKLISLNTWGGRAGKWF
jgi:hypothetical protein